MQRTYILEAGAIREAETPTANILIFIRPTAEEMRELSTTHGIDEHNLNSALDPDELGRLEIEDNHNVVIIKRPKNYCTDDNFLFQVSSFGCFLFADKLIIVMPEDIQTLWSKQFKKIRTLPDALLKIVYGTISHFLSHLKIISLLTDSIEEKIDTAVGNKYLQNMFSLEKSLVFYFNGIHSNAMLFEKIRNNAGRIGFTEDNLEVLEDIMIDNNQCLKQAEISTNIISGIMSTHASIVGNNLNATIHRLTFITTVFMPLTLIASIGGMSEWTMMTETMGWPLSYGILLVGMVGVGFLMYFLLKRFTRTQRRVDGRGRRKEKEKKAEE
ncbi:MAG TPA: magnesium transporter CorA family protein [Spirochaetia bacterium]|nr:magnesium transporter CorA family protein [Spirochaetia bacterium]